MTDTSGAAHIPASSSDGEETAPDPARHHGVGKIAGKLSSVNLLILLGGFITGPLQAHVLGPVGLGELAAISSTMALAAPLGSFGLNTYASWAVAQGRRVGDVLGTTIRLYAVIGAVIVVASFPLAGALSGGHAIVRVFLTIGFITLPIVLVGWVYMYIAIGLEEWDTVIGAKFITTMIGIAPVVVLFVAGALTVPSAAVASMCGNLAFLLPVVAVWRLKPRPLRWSKAIAREGTRFGSRAWLGGISAVTNGRLDQVLMISFVGSRELGLYAAAVTMSTVFVTVVAGAIQYAIMPQVSRGNSELVRQAARTTVALSIVFAAAVALVSPLVLRYLFGSAFEGAETMLLILLAASLALALNIVLSSACSSGGQPGAAARAELYAVAITVPGLLLFLGPFGGTGAAIVSCLAYGFTDGYLLRASRRRFGGRFRDYVLPRREDLERVIGLAQQLVVALGHRLPGAKPS